MRIINNSRSKLMRPDPDWLGQVLGRAESVNKSDFIIYSS